MVKMVILDFYNLLKEFIGYINLLTPNSSSIVILSQSFFEYLDEQFLEDKVNSYHGKLKDTELYISFSLKQDRQHRKFFILESIYEMDIIPIYLRTNTQDKNTDIVLFTLLSEPPIKKFPKFRGF